MRRTVDECFLDLIENNPCTLNAPESWREPVCKRGEDHWCLNCYDRWIAEDGLAILRGEPRKAYRHSAARERLLDEPVNHYPLYEAVVAEAKRTSHQSVPGTMTFTVLEKSRP